MHVFIPGGAGQVGSILVPALLKSGYTVTVYDQLPQDAFHQIKNHSHLKLVTGSFKDLPCMEAALNGCETIIYLANNLDILDLPSFESFLQISSRKVANHFIYTSSFAIYENSDKSSPSSSTLIKFKKDFEETFLKYKTDSLHCTLVSPKTIYDQTCIPDNKIQKKESLEGYSTVEIQDLIYIYLELIKAPLKLLNKQKMASNSLS